MTAGSHYTRISSGWPGGGSSGEAVKHWVIGCRGEEWLVATIASSVQMIAEGIRSAFDDDQRDRFQIISYEYSTGARPASFIAHQIATWSSDIRYKEGLEIVDNRRVGRPVRGAAYHPETLAMMVLEHLTDVDILVPARRHPAWHLDRAVLDSWEAAGRLALGVES